MTNNIAKLYELALGYKCNMPDVDCNHNCSKCEDYIPNKFTPEKQLELIKFISNFKVYETLKQMGGKWFMCASIGCNDYYEARNTNFSQALSGLVIQLWNDLTDEQRNKVKEILK